MIKTVVTGNVVNEVELTTTKNGEIPYAKIRLASNRHYKNREGNLHTDFITVRIYGKLAEICEKYLYLGSKVLVVGDLETYQVEREPPTTGFTIKAHQVEFLSPKKEGEETEIEPEETE